MASASAWLHYSPPRHPLPDTSSAVAGLVPCYYHLLHLLHLLHLHLTAVHHSSGIGLVTRFPATVPATSHFLGGCALRRALPLNNTVAHPASATALSTDSPPRHLLPDTSSAVVRSGRRSHSTSRLRATASASALSPDSQPRHPLPHTSSVVARSGVCSHSTSRLHPTVSASALSPCSPARHLLHHTSSAVAGMVPRYYHLLHLLHLLHLRLTVACYGTGIGFVTRFPPTAPATSHFLGGRRLGPMLLPPPLPPPPPPPPPLGCMPRHRYRLGYPIPCHGTRYLTLPRRSCTPVCTPTQLHGCAPDIGIGFVT